MTQHAGSSGDGVLLESAVFARLLTHRDVHLKGWWHCPERRPRAQGKVLLPFLGVGERPEAVGWAPNDANTSFLVRGGRKCDRAGGFDACPSVSFPPAAGRMMCC